MAERELRPLIEARVQGFRQWMNSCSERSVTRVVLGEVIALLQEDLGDGVCRCVRNNGVGPYGSTELWCSHGKNDACPRCGARKAREDKICGACEREAGRR